MFTKEQLEGIILSLAYPEIDIARDDKQSIGYRIRLRVNFRVMNKEFLLMLQESLEHYGVDSYFKEVEKKGRPYPLLRLTNVDNLLQFYKLIPELPKSNNKFDSFLEVLTVVSNKHHLSQKGFDRILIIKGLST
tara:strand:+ start:1085 stop:1486 length:402 start_codon:yes stop_codon:yes gene_type:complete